MTDGESKPAMTTSANPTAMMDESRHELVSTKTKALSNPWLLFSAGVAVGGAIWTATSVNTAYHPLTGISGYVLAQLLAVAVFTDLSNRKIPNWATYSAFVWALVLNVAAFIVPEQNHWLGSVGLTQSLAGGFGMLVIMFIMFSISGGGAGDVKMAACIGALLGWDLAVNAMLYGFVVAGAGLLCFTIWARGPLFIAQAILRTIGHKLLPAVIDPPVKQQSEMMKQKFPLAPFFAVGTLLAIYWN
ncbi:MAG: A24 family peptidase [Pirellulaceae bacterium]